MKALGAAAISGPFLPGPEAQRSIQRINRPERTLGLFLLFHVLPRPADVEAFKDLVLRAGANTIVVDIKNPWGYVNVPFEHKLRARYRSYLEDPRPLEQLLNWADRNRIFSIARQVVMMDGQMARHFPQYALRDANGDIWKDLTDTPWANPFEPLVADYNAAIAEAAVRQFGFRQVQYDVIRFPSGDSRIADIRYGRRSTAKNRAEAISHFLKLAGERVNRYQALLTADLFGHLAFTYQGDVGIGQELECLGPHVYGVSPMAYPSLYRGGILLEECPGFCNPGIDYPYEIVNLTVSHTRRRLEAVNPKAFVEPWIQAYAPARAEHIRLQHRGALDAGAVGVLAWHTNFKYYDPLSFVPLYP